jgi:hypothetical protein
MSRCRIAAVATVVRVTNFVTMRPTIISIVAAIAAIAIVVGVAVGLEGLDGRFQFGVLIGELINLGSESRQLVGEFCKTLVLVLFVVARLARASAAAAMVASAAAL